MGDWRSDAYKRYLDLGIKDKVSVSVKMGEIGLAQL